MRYRFAEGLGRRLLLAVAFLGSVSAGAGPRREELFRIERSTNRNVVEYDIRLLADGRVDRDKPISAYWRLFAEDGRRENLTWLESKFAYGFSVELEPDGLVLKLMALAHRGVRIKKNGTRWCATINIGGKSAILRRVWVQAESTVLGPHVRWVELRGADERTGEQVAERISND